MKIDSARSTPFPSLPMAERIASRADIPLTELRVSPSAAIAALGEASTLDGLRLVARGGRPVYLLHRRNAPLTALWADDGRPAALRDAETDKNAPLCAIIAGPNGAGKTTFALHYLPSMLACRNFVNADAIAAGLSPLAPEHERIYASRLFLQEIEQYIHKRESLAFETTLSGRS